MQGLHRAPSARETAQCSCQHYHDEHVQDCHEIVAGLQAPSGTLAGVQFLVVPGLSFAVPAQVEPLVAEIVVGAAVEPALVGERSLVIDGLTRVLLAAPGYYCACLGLPDVSLAALVERTQV
jgi:hypothetical protein